MIGLQQQDGLWAFSTGDFRICFTRKADRWAHLLAVGRREGQRRSFTDSEETDSEGRPPSSPVFQEIHAQESAGGVTFLLVGQHGVIHYSASFAVSELSRGPASVVRVQADVAARSRQPGKIPTSTYRVYQRGYALAEADGRRLRWRLDEPGQEVALGAGFAAAEGANAGTPSLLLTDNTEGGDWTVTVFAGAQLDRSTTRWAYYWEFSVDEPS